MASTAALAFPLFFHYFSRSMLEFLLDPVVLFPLCAVLGCILLSAFFSGSETALTAISRARIYRLVMDGNRRAQTVSKLRREKESLIGAILLGNTVVNIGASAIATSFAIQHWGDTGVAIATVVLTIVILMFGEILPKTIAIQNSERVSLFVAPVLWVVIRILSPLVQLIQRTLRYIMLPFGVDITRSDTLVSAQDAIRGTIELHHSEGEMVKQDRDMLGSILDLSDITVVDVMIHRKHTEMIDSEDPAESIVKRAIESGHSRIPLYKDGPENIIGVLHVKELLREINRRSTIALTNAQILAIVSEPWFIPDTTTLKDQLFAFRERRQHFALVVDEYGALLGIVTLEDIIEEIVGEIDDEHDRNALPGVVKRGEQAYDIDGSVTLRDIQRQLDWKLPDEDASTIAGLLIHEARQIPEIGAVFEFHGFRFTVLAKSANQITQLRVERLGEPTPINTQ